MSDSKGKEVAKPTTAVVRREVGNWLVAREVRRYHTCPLSRDNTVAEHSANVAWLCAYLTNGKASAALLLMAVMHDLGEYATGDIPAPTKRALNPAAKKEVDDTEAMGLAALGIPVPVLTPEENAVLSLCDSLEGYVTCRQDVQRGNRTALPVGENFRVYTTQKLHAYVREFPTQPLLDAEKFFRVMEALP